MEKKKDSKRKRSREVEAAWEEEKLGREALD